MATYTSRFKIKKPDGTDPFLTSDFDSNYDLLDSSIPSGHLATFLSVSTSNIVASNLAQATICRGSVNIPNPGSNTQRAVYISCSYPVAYSSSGLFLMSIYRDGALLVSWEIAAYQNTSFNPGETWYIGGSYLHPDSPVYGTHTYDWRIQAEPVYGVTNPTATLEQSRGGVDKGYFRASMSIFEF